MTHTLLQIEDLRLEVGPLRVGHLLEIERRMLAERRDPLNAVITRWDEFSESQRRELLEAAFEYLARPLAATFAEIIAWMNQPLGTAFALWLVARDGQPELSWDDCRARVLKAPLETLERIQRALSPEMWESAVGNSFGQTQPAHRAAPGAACSVS
jgi:hypothetical protein